MAIRGIGSPVVGVDEEKGLTMELSGGWGYFQDTRRY